jgi:hypothetical protein
LKQTIEEKAYDICGNKRFGNREKREIAQRIVDFMGIPARTPFHTYRKSFAELALQRYHGQVRNLTAHLNARYYGWMIQSGQIP